MADGAAAPFAGNLPSGISERDLEDEFIRFGTLRSVWIARKPPGFGAHRRPPQVVFATPLGIT
jgi:RNA recognition motif-containing protein